MIDYKKKYYEQPVFWEKGYLTIPAEKERIARIIEAIPSKAHSILDIGCGSGHFVNTLINTFPGRFDRVIGLDSSEEALKHVEAEKVNGTIAELPFEDESFDLVTSLEVLEHLSQEDFKNGISELQRVSRKYVIITVPNNEDLERSNVTCLKCRCRYNPYYHVRSFNENTLQTLLESFRLIKIQEIGPTEKYYSYNPLLVTFFQTWKKPIPPVTAICPQCGFQRKDKLDSLKKRKSMTNPSSLLVESSLRYLAHLITPIKGKKKWLLALYEKPNG
jgi:ubiquinone/menaquinone biosynthesis C-methylase UbiE